MEDWRAERDRALLALENEKRSAFRREAADLLHALAADGADRAEEMRAVVPRLIADADPNVRRTGTAIGALVLPREEAQQFLGARLGDAEETVRIEAAGQLADLVSPTARGLLALAMQDASFSVRFEGARGMAALQHSAGIEVLIEALGLPELRFRALGALAELGDERAAPPIEKLFRRWLLPAFDRTQAAGALARFGDREAAAFLMQRSRKRWAADRAMAVELCGEVKAEGAREQLAGILARRDDECRGAAARGLGRLGDPSVLPLLAAVLDERSHGDDLRLDAAEGLVLLGTEEALGRVRAAVDSFEAAEARAEARAMLEDSP